MKKTHDANMKHCSGEAATKKGHKGAAFSGKTIPAKKKDFNLTSVFFSPLQF